MKDRDMATNYASRPDLLLTQQDGCLSVVLNRPDAANALTNEQTAHLVELLESASVDPDVRVVSLAAKGRHFCAGMDLRASRPEPGPVPTGPERYPGQTMSAISKSQRLISAVLDCMKPVVAIVNGPAAGMGLYLAMASDLVVASKSAAFVEAFLPRGMVLHCQGAHLLVARLGMQRAKEFVLLGGRFTAEEAHDLGLINRLVPDDKLEDAATELLGRLAAAPTIAVGLSKRLLNRAVGSDRGTALSDEIMAMEINGSTHDYSEGGAAFIERRAPSYLGW